MISVYLLLDLMSGYGLLSSSVVTESVYFVDGTTVAAAVLNDEAEVAEIFHLAQVPCG